MPNIKIEQGSILDFEGDVIVNPANSHLRHTGGLARIIAKAAAPLGQYTSLDDAYYRTGDDLSLYDQDEAWEREQAAQPLVPTGGAIMTSAGRLPYRGIIHAVGPVWGGGNYMEMPLLSIAHRSALEVATEAGFRSIAFPAISCGVFGFPVEYAAPIAITAAWVSKLDITFYLFEDEHFAAYEQAVSAIQNGGSPV